MIDMFLAEEEIQRLTNRRQHAAQARALRTMGIECKKRVDGSIAVLRAHVESQFGIRPEQTRQRIEPNWSSLA